MNVAQLMTRGVQAVAAEDMLHTAAEKMWRADIGCLPVVNGDRRPIGIITDRDICMAAYTQGGLLREIQVATAMSKEVFSCVETDSLIEAEETMRSRKVRRLPVVSPEGVLIGIISLNDLAREAERERGARRRELSPQEVASTLAAVCEPREPANMVVSRN